MVSVVALVAMLVLMDTAAATRAATKATPKSTLTIGIPGAGATFDPMNGTSQTAEILAFTSTQLIHQEPSGAFTAGLATSWRYIKDPAGPNMAFELTLRRGARFSDGSPVTAQAVKQWLSYAASTAGSYASLLGPKPRFNTVGRWTLKIHMSISQPILPVVLSRPQYGWGLVSAPKAVAKPADLGTATFGAGPYTLLPSQTVSGDHYTLVPNKFYWDKAKIKFSRIIIKVIPNPAAMLQALETHQIDIASGDTTTAGAAASAGLRVISTQGAALGVLFPDRGGTIVKALADPRVRQAFNYAIDRKTITRALVGKYGLPSSEPYIPGAWVSKYQNYYPYNPGKAKTLLDAAGYGSGLTVDALGLPSAVIPNGPALTQAIAKYLGAVGITLNLTEPTSVGDFVSQAFSGKFPVMIWPGIYETSGWSFYSVFSKPGGIVNQHGWSDPTMAQVWSAGQRSTNPTRYWLKLTRRFVEQADSAPVFISKVIWYVGKRVGGAIIDGTNNPIPDVLALYPKRG